jgi:hypothetical protein
VNVCKCTRGFPRARLAFYKPLMRFGSKSPSERPRLSLVPAVPGLASPAPAPARRTSAAPHGASAGAAPGGPTVRARVASVTDSCWQCRSKVRAVVGVLVDPAATDNGTGFLPFDDVSEELAATLDPRTLAARRIGEIKHRDSPGVAGGYVSNGCIECDALIGRFALEDLVHEHLAAGGTYAQLDIGIPLELPAATPAGLRIFG